MDIAMPRTIPDILMDAESDKYLSPEDYTYWKARENRTFYIDYEIDDDYRLIELSKIIIQLNIEEKDTSKEQLKPIYLFIHSYGGSLEQALFFCDLIRASRIPIITVSMGIAMSSGFLIFIAADNRYIFKHSQLLVHQGYAGFQGTADEVDQATKNYKKQLNQMKEYILERTEIPEKVFSRNQKKDWFLTTDEIMDYKVATKIIDNFDDIMQ